MTSKLEGHDLTVGSTLSKLLKVAVPAILIALVNTAYSLTDLFWVSSVDSIGLVKEEAVSAVGIGGYFLWFSMGFLLMPAIGTQILVSQAFGKKDNKSLEDTATNGVRFAFILGIVIGLIMTIFAPQLVSIFGYSEGAINDYAVTYIRIVGVGQVFYYTSYALSQIFIGIGSSTTAFKVGTTGLVINMLLDPLFILVFSLGVTGAALATVTSYVITFSIYLYIFVSKKKPFSLNIKSRVRFDIIKKIANLGYSPSVQSIFFTIIAIYVGTKVTPYENAFPAMQIGTQIESFSWNIAGGLQTAMVAFIGQNYGAHKYDRIKESHKLTAKILVIYGLFISIIFFVFAKPFMSIFFDNSETLMYGDRYLKILSLSQIFMLFEIGFTGYASGLGKPTVPAYVGMICNFLRIPVLIILVPHYGVYGIWFAITLMTMFKGIIIYGYSIILNKKYINQ